MKAGPPPIAHLYKIKFEYFELIKICTERHSLARDKGAPNISFNANAKAKANENESEREICKRERERSDNIKQ